MLVFKDAKHIEPMLRESLLGSYQTQVMIEDYGYAFSLIHGKEKLGYACFFYSEGALCVAVEFSSYDSMLFGEVYDGMSRDLKKRQFVEFCQENGISEKFAQYWLSLLERIAVGERVILPGTSKSTISYELQVMLTKAARELAAMDEADIYERLCELHKQFRELETVYPFGYSSKPFEAMGKTFGKRKGRFSAYADFIGYLMDCTKQIHQTIENYFLGEIIEEELITQI